MANTTVRVLVVDDDPLNLAYVREALAQAGATVTAIGDAPGALAHAQSLRFDLVLCDLRMPALDGEAFLRALRAYGASSDARVVAMSADLPRAERARLRAAGFHDALPKPIAAATLAALVGGTIAAPSPMRSAGDAILDDAHALRALGSDDAVRALRSLLRDELPALKAALAAAAGDATVQRELLHRLVGGAELCGAVGLAQAARERSRALAAGGGDGEALEHAFAATFAALVSR